MGAARVQPARGCARRGGLGLGARRGGWAWGQEVGGARLQPLMQLLRFGDEQGLVLDEGENGHLDRGQARVELEQRALLAAHLVLAVGRGEHGQHQPVDANRGLDDVRDVLFLELVVKVPAAAAAATCLWAACTGRSAPRTP